MGAPHLRIVDEDFIPEQPGQVDELIKELAELNKAINVKRQDRKSPIEFDALMNELCGLDQMGPSRPKAKPVAQLVTRPMAVSKTGPKARPAKKRFVIPVETETLRNRHGNGVLTSYIKKVTGCDRVKLNEIYYNRAYRLSVEAHIS